MNLFNALLGAKVGGGGYPEPTGTYNVSKNGTYYVKDYAYAKVDVKGYYANITIQNRTGYRLEACQFVGQSGQSQGSVTFGNNSSKTVYYPKRSEGQTTINSAPVFAGTIIETAQGQVQELAASIDSNGRAVVYQKEIQVPNENAYYVLVAVVADFVGDGTTITLTEAQTAS